MATLGFDAIENSAIASIPLVSVTSIDRARMTMLSTDSGRPTADDELVTSSERTRPGNASVKRVAMPAPSDRPPTWARRSRR